MRSILPASNGHIALPWQDARFIWFHVVLPPYKGLIDGQPRKSFSRVIWRRTEDPDWRLIHIGDRASCLSFHFILGPHSEILVLLTMPLFHSKHCLVFIRTLSHEVFFLLLRFKVELARDDLLGILGNPLAGRLLWPTPRNQARYLHLSCIFRSSDSELEISEGVFWGPYFLRAIFGLWFE